MLYISNSASETIHTMLRIPGVPPEGGVRIQYARTRPLTPSATTMGVCSSYSTRLGAEMRHFAVYRARQNRHVQRGWWFTGSGGNSTVATRRKNGAS